MDDVARHAGSGMPRQREADMPDASPRNDAGGRSSQLGSSWMMGSGTPGPMPGDPVRGKSIIKLMRMAFQPCRGMTAMYGVASGRTKEEF
ncbi:MAG: hypothetical protein WDN25_03475 [Acetobacteraceae bacterium]